MEKQELKHVKVTPKDFTFFTNTKGDERAIVIALNRKKSAFNRIFTETELNAEIVKWIDKIPDNGKYKKRLYLFELSEDMKNEQTIQYSIDHREWLIVLYTAMLAFKKNTSAKTSMNSQSNKAIVRFMDFNFYTVSDGIGISCVASGIHNTYKHVFTKKELYEELDRTQIYLRNMGPKSYNPNFFVNLNSQCAIDPRDWLLVLEEAVKEMERKILKKTDEAKSTGLVRFHDFYISFNRYGDTAHITVANGNNAFKADYTLKDLEKAEETIIYNLTTQLNACDDRKVEETYQLTSSISVSKADWLAVVSTALNGLKKITVKNHSVENKSKFYVFEDFEIKVDKSHMTVLVSLKRPANYLTFDLQYSVQELFHRYNGLSEDLKNGKMIQELSGSILVRTTEWFAIISTALNKLKSENFAEFSNLLMKGKTVIHNLGLDNKALTIEVTPRPNCTESNDYRACIQGNPTIWDCGRSPQAAIGALVLSHQRELRIAIKQK